MESHSAANPKIPKNSISTKQRSGSNNQLIHKSYFSREELSSQIDMAVGSGSLLLKGKCKQFRELCLKNVAEAGDGKQKEAAEFPTTKEDLEGDSWRTLVLFAVFGLCIYRSLVITNG